MRFLDEREHDRDRVHEILRGYGKLGVVGPFQALFGNDGNYVAEVVSVWPSNCTGSATSDPTGSST